MLTRALLSLRGGCTVLAAQMRRNFGVTGVVTQQAADPIQQLFVDKIRDYAKKSQ